MLLMGVGTHKCKLWVKLRTICAMGGGNWSGVKWSNCGLGWWNETVESTVNWWYLWMDWGYLCFVWYYLCWFGSVCWGFLVYVIVAGSLVVLRRFSSFCGVSWSFIFSMDLLLYVVNWWYWYRLVVSIVVWWYLWYLWWVGGIWSVWLYLWQFGSICGGSCYLAFFCGFVAICGGLVVSVMGWCYLWWFGGTCGGFWYLCWVGGILSIV